MRAARGPARAWPWARGEVDGWGCLGLFQFEMGVALLLGVALFVIRMRRARTATPYL